ncbi:MAG: LuxR C-terminal-related transcriptional regulator [Kiloniellales bacterium]
MRTIIADDHPVVRDATASLLRNRYGEQADIVCVGTYDALLLALKMAPVDLIIVDLDMPDLGSTRNLTTVMREAREVPLIVFSSSRAVSVMRSSRQQGASGYVCKSDSHDTLLRAVEVVLEGGQFFQEETVAPCRASEHFLPSSAPTATAEESHHLRKPWKPRPTDLPSLTPRQQEILQCLSQGLSNKEIARALGISDSTVKVHMHGLFERLGVQNRTQAALLARRSENPGQGTGRDADQDVDDCAADLPLPRQTGS